MAAREVIDAFQSLWQAAASVTWVNHSELRINLAQSVDFSALRILEKGDLFPKFRESELQQRYDAETQGIASNTEISYTTPRTLDGIVVIESIGKLLGIEGAQTREPAAYILIGSREKNALFHHIRGESLSLATPLIQRYHDAVSLWQLLRAHAQHEEESTGSLLFFNLRRTEVQPGFDASDLEQDILVRDIDGFLSNSDRAETRTEIFASVLSEFLRDHKPAAAFRAILRDSVRFARRLKEGLAIYLSEHSPQKLAEEAKASAIGLSEKLEKLIGGLETKSLSIPVAVLLAVKDIAPGGGFTALNSIVAASALTYAITMTLVHQSQSALLGLLRCTIETTESDYKSKGLDANNPVLTSTYGALKSRTSGAQSGSYLMCVFSWAPLICVLGVMLLGTPKPETFTKEATQSTPANTPKTPNQTPAQPAPMPAIRFNLPAPTNQPSGAPTP
ncbi:MAG: hypothetical protein QM760_20945 [Nibricoccus sp.]